MLAWMSSSVMMVSPLDAIQENKPILALYPELKIKAASAWWIEARVVPFPQPMKNCR
jgi:hypothetical protein